MTPSTQNSVWESDAWDKMRDKLEQLGLDDLKLLAIRAGIHFTDGIDSLKDKEQSTVKDQIISVLEEVSSRELLDAYEKIQKPRGSI